ncbi:MAG TPA: hypothetical protein VGL46_02660 [Pseudonocardiaceae bacterium]
MRLDTPAREWAGLLALLLGISVVGLESLLDSADGATRRATYGAELRRGPGSPC